MDGNVGELPVAADMVEMGMCVDDRDGHPRQSLRERPNWGDAQAGVDQDRAVSATDEPRIDVAGLCNEPDVWCDRLDSEPFVHERSLVP